MGFDITVVDNEHNYTDDEDLDYTYSRGAWEMSYDVQNFVVDNAELTDSGYYIKGDKLLEFIVFVFKLDTGQVDVTDTGYMLLEVEYKHRLIKMALFAYDMGYELEFSW